MSSQTMPELAPDLCTPRTFHNNKYQPTSWQAISGLASDSCNRRTWIHNKNNPKLSLAMRDPHDLSPNGAVTTQAGV